MKAMEPPSRSLRNVLYQTFGTPHLVPAFLMVMQNVLGDLLLLPVDPAGDGDYYEGPRGEGC